MGYGKVISGTLILLRLPGTGKGESPGNIVCTLLVATHSLTGLQSRLYRVHVNPRRPSEVNGDVFDFGSSQVGKNQGWSEDHEILIN